MNKKDNFNLYLFGMNGVGISSITNYLENRHNQNVKSKLTELQRDMEPTFIFGHHSIICNDSEWYNKKIDENFDYNFNCDVSIIVFDVSNKKSFIESIYFLHERKKWLKNNKYVKPKSFVLIANKCDLKREITTEEAMKQVKKLNINYYVETSTKNDKGLYDLIDNIYYKHNELIKETYKKLGQNIITQKMKYSCVVS